MKKINDQKLQAFTIGSFEKRQLSKKEQDKLRKKEEEEAAANAFREYVDTFQEVSKVWVKAGTYDAGSRREDNREKGKLYKPASKVDDKSTAEKAQDYAKMLASDPKKELKKKTQEKKKSNLELFKEELRQIQEEREERHKYKNQAKTMISIQPAATTAEPDPIFDEVDIGSFDNGDPNTTNLFLGNLSPKISEQQLMELFGKYGPLASIKIMWPRSEEEKSRGRNCGFVAYMSRADAFRALRALNGKYVMGYEMKLGWGKSVPIMTHPIYIPPALLEYAMPPPPSGLPFNAQPPPSITNIPKVKSAEYMTDPDVKNELDEVLYKSVVKVVIPNERPVLTLIHRMVEFVIREGPMFEAIIMNREIENPLFRFLFDNDSPAHIYYRWKLFSLLQGDIPTEWRQNEFRMFKGGSIWKPPPVNFYAQGMPEELITDDFGEPNKGALSTAQRDRLEDLIRHLTPERSKIGDAMIFCIEHAEAADEICECIAESLTNSDTLIHKKIARLYLVSDILHNCGVKVQNTSFFRKSLERNLIEMFRGLHESYKNLESRIKAEGFKVRVFQVFRAWEELAVYPREFLTRLQNIFLGLPEAEPTTSSDIDGAPLSGDEKEDEDLDGVPLDGAALLKGALLRGIPEAKPTIREHSMRNPENSREYIEQEDDDIDGIPLDEDIDGIPLEKFPDDGKNQGGAFVPSKWETVDPEQIEAQAVTTSKWDTLEPVQEHGGSKDQDSDISMDDMFDNSSRDFDEDKRNRLREIELKLIQYQDELEIGSRSIKPGWNIQQQVEHYRRKLMRKSDKDFSNIMTNENSTERYSGSTSSTGRKEIIGRRSVSPIDVVQSKKTKKYKRSPSPLYSKSSPVRSTKSRKSRSPYSRRGKDSTSPIPRNNKSSKRHRSSDSRSDSDSPKRFREKSISPTRSSSRYDTGSPKKYRSPSPTVSKSSFRYAIGSPNRISSSSSSRRASSPLSSRSSSRLIKETSPVRYKSPSRHRSDKHKHKHKY